MLHLMDARLFIVIQTQSVKISVGMHHNHKAF